MANLEANEEIEVYGEQVREVLNTPPAWLTRTGSGMAMLFLLVMILLTYFIRYPDVLTGQIVISSAEPPVSLVARVDGKIQNLAAKEDELVEVGQLLVVLENTANLADVERLKKLLAEFNPSFGTDAASLTFPENLHLGDIQTTYAALVFSFDSWHNYKNTHAREQKIALLRKQREEYLVLKQKQISQEIQLRAVIEITETEMGRDDTLLKEGVIAKADHEIQQKELLRVQNALESNDVEQSRTQITITELERQILNLSTTVTQSSNDLRLRVVEAYQNLQQSIENWERNYLLYAPIAGKVSYFSYWTNFQNVKAGEEVVSVLPLGENDYLGKALIPVSNAGKLAEGQMAQVKLANYPYQEFGILIGNVDKVSAVPKQGYYLLDIAFSQPLITNQHKTIEIKEQVEGQVEIVTEELRLLERIFYGFRGVFN